MALPPVVRGVAATANRLDALAGTARNAAIRYLNDEAERVLNASKDLCPIDEQVLYNSGRVIVDTSGKDPTFDIEYGGEGSGAEGYALVVHEHPSPHDPPSWRGKAVNFTRGGPKFLEIPYRRAASTFQARLTAHFRRFL